MPVKILKFFLLVSFLFLTLIASVAFNEFRKSSDIVSERKTEKHLEDKKVEDQSLGKYFEEAFKKSGKELDSINKENRCEIFGEEVGKNVVIFDTTCSLSE